MTNRNELIPMDPWEEIQQYKEKTLSVVEYVKDLKIETKTDAEKALDLAVEAINLREKIEDKRKEITEPSRKFQGEVNRIAKEFTESLDEVKDVVVESIDEWKDRNGIVQELGTSKVQMLESAEFSFDVVDIEAVPREYLVVDKDRVKLLMKQGVREIPGLEISKSKKTTLRRR